MKPLSVPVSDEMVRSVRRAVRAALAYEKATGGRRKMGITGEVGEVLACHALGLRIAVSPRNQGYDAVDRGGRHVQIKTRRSESPGLPRDVGRIGTFSAHPFHYALLVILDHEYRLVEIWRASYRDIWPVIETQKRRNPNLAAFKKRARCIWPKKP